MQLLNDKDVDNAKIVRACIFSACIVAFSQNVKLPILRSIVDEMYHRISISLGMESIFPPGES